MPLSCVLPVYYLYYYFFFETVLLILLFVLLVHNVFLAAFYCLAAVASFSLVFCKKVTLFFFSWEEGEKRENSGQERDRRFLFQKKESDRRFVLEM